MFSQQFLVDTLTRLTGSTTEDARWRCAAALFQACGSDWVTAGTASRHGQSALAIRTTTPDGLMRDYMAERLYLEDPWMAHCATSTDIDSSDLSDLRGSAPGKLRSRQARLFADHGVYRALLVPSYGGVRPGGIVLYARSKDAALWMAGTEGLAKVRLATALVAAFYRPEADASGSPERYAVCAVLSSREREVLQWLSCGLQSGAIAERMGLETVTVAKHLRNARRKLGAVTREQALGIAVRDGLLAI